MEAVKKDGYAIQYVRNKNKTPELYIAAVKQNPNIIEYIGERSPELCLAAVERDWLMISFIKNRTPEICIAAVNQNIEALEFVPAEMFLADTKSFIS